MAETAETTGSTASRVWQTETTETSSGDCSGNISTTSADTVNPVLVDCVNDLGTRVDKIVNGIKVSFESLPDRVVEKPLTHAEKQRAKDKSRNRKRDIKETRQFLTAMSAVIDGFQANTRFQSSLKPEIRAIMSCERWVMLAQMAKVGLTIVLSEQTRYIKDIPPELAQEVADVHSKIDDVIDDFTASIGEVSTMLQDNLTKK